LLCIIGLIFFRGRAGAQQAPCAGKVKSNHQVTCKESIHNRHPVKLLDRNFLATISLQCRNAPLQEAPFRLLTGELESLLISGLCFGLSPKPAAQVGDRNSPRLNSSHVKISYAVFCLKKKKY